jgi:hypothetical protein
MRFSYRGMCCRSQATLHHFASANCQPKKNPNSMMRAVAKWCVKQSQPTAISHCSLTKHNRLKPPSTDWTDVRKGWKTAILERWQNRTLHRIREYLCDCIRKQKFHYLPPPSVCVSHPSNKYWTDGQISIKYGPTSIKLEIAHLSTRILEFNIIYTVRIRREKHACQLMNGPRILCCDAFQRACKFCYWHTRTCCAI